MYSDYSVDVSFGALLDTLSLFHDAAWFSVLSGDLNAFPVFDFK